MKTKIILILVIILSIIGFAIALTFNNEEPLIEYSQEELEWLKDNENKSLYYYIEDEVPGIFEDLIVTLELLLNMDFVETNDLDIIEAKKGLIFSQNNTNKLDLIRTHSIYTTRYSLYENSTLKEQDHINHKIGVIRSDYNHIDFESKYSGYEIVRVNNYSELMTLINGGFIDCFIMRNNSPLIIQDQETVFVKDKSIYSKDENLVGYLNNQQVVLQQILNKNIKHIKNKSIIDNIQLKKLSLEQEELFNQLLTSEEVKWLESHSEVTIGIEAQAPEIIREDDKVYGITVGIINQYAELTKSKVNIIYGETQKLLDEANAYNIDMIWSPTKKDIGYDSIPFIMSNYVVVGTSNEVELESKYDLQQYTIGMVFNESITSKLSDELDSTSISYYDNDDELVEGVLSNETDYIIMSKSKFNYYETVLGYAQLDKQLELEDIYESRIAVLEDSELLAIINKVILVQDLELLQATSFTDIPIIEEVTFSDYILLIVIFIILFIAMVLILIRMYMNDKEKRQMNYLFTHDQLTHLPNKYGIKHHVDGLISESEKFHILLIDIDNLKEINDRLGHLYGDQVIVEYSQSLLGVLKSEIILGRTGGDEFVLVSTNNEEEAVEQLISKVRKQTELFRESKAELYSFTVSIAITSYPNYGHSYDELYKFLEYTLDHTKLTNGDNSQLIFTYDIYDNFVQEQKLIKEIKHGINNNEFILHIQPQVQLPDENVIGGELLVRWNHPIKGMIYPDSFIPVAEKNGLMRDLDYYIFTKACKLIEEWQKSYNPMKVSVNMSTTTFEDEDMIEKVTGIITDNHMDPSWLTIEVTEDMGFHNLEKAKILFDKLRTLNINVALDDFGKGYSSLAYLEKLNFDFLKVDKVFIDNIHVKRESYEIFNTIINLAKTMNLEVVTEGVEYKEQLDIIKKHSNVVVQGYYYSKPLSIENFTKYIQNN